MLGVRWGKRRRRPRSELNHHNSFTPFDFIRSVHDYEWVWYEWYASYALKNKKEQKGKAVYILRSNGRFSRWILINRWAELFCIHLGYLGKNKFEWRQIETRWRARQADFQDFHAIEKICKDSDMTCFAAERRNKRNSFFFVCVFFVFFLFFFLWGGGGGKLLCCKCVGASLGGESWSRTCTHVAPSSISHLLIMYF